MVNVKIIKRNPKLEEKYKTIIHEIRCRPQPSTETTLIFDGKRVKATDIREIIIDNYNIWIDGISVDLKNVSKISSETTISNNPVF